MILEERQALMEALKSPDEEARREAMEALKEGIGAGDLDWLTSPLADESWRVRKEAIEGLSRVTPTATLVGRLIPLMDPSRELTLRNSVVEVLERMGRDAAPFIAAHLSIDQVDIRKFLVDILGNIGDPSVAKDMVRMLRDPVDNIRAAAAEGLASMGDPSMTRVLIDALEGADDWVVFSILGALARIGGKEPLPHFFRYLGNPILSKAAITGIGAAGGEEEAVRLMGMVPSLSRGASKSAFLAAGMIHRRLADEGAHSSTLRKAVRKVADASSASFFAGQLGATETLESRRDILAVLGLMGGESCLEAVVASVEEEVLDADVRLALFTLGQEEPSRVLDLFAHPNELVRRKAVQVAAQLDGPGLLSVIVPMLEDPSGHVRKEAARALAALGDASVLGSLIRLLADDYRDVAQAAGEAIVALGRRRPSELSEAIEPMFAEADTSERALLLRILGEVDVERNLPRFLSALQDEEPEMRAAALSCLQRSVDPAAWPPVVNSLTDESSEVRVQAAMSLEKLRPPEALGPLKAALFDQDPWVRAAAVSALSVQPGMEPGDFRELLEGDDLMIRTSVVEALGRLAERGRAGALPLLESAFGAGSVEIRRAVCRTLTRVPDPKVVEVLLTAATDEDPTVRTFAAHALAARPDQRAQSALAQMAERDPVKAVRDAARSLKAAGP